MAGKKKDEAGVQAFVAEILATVPEDQRGAVEAALTNASVADTLRAGYLHQSEYSRSMDALRDERKRFEDEVARTKENFQGWESWYADTTKTLADVQGELQSYRETFGPLDGVQTRQATMTREDVARTVDELIARRSADFFNSTIAATDMLDDLKWEHRTKFGKGLNTQELLKFCQERGLPVQAGYKEYVAGDLADLQEKEVQRRIDEAREQGAREALSRHKLPVAPASFEPRPLDMLDASKGPLSEGDRISAAVASFNDAVAGK